MAGLGVHLLDGVLESPPQRVVRCEREVGQDCVSGWRVAVHHAGCLLLNGWFREFGVGRGKSGVRCCWVVLRLARFRSWLGLDNWVGWECYRKVVSMLVSVAKVEDGSHPSLRTLPAC
jgi:hypothetical protein